MARIDPTPEQKERPISLSHMFFVCTWRWCVLSTISGCGRAVLLALSDAKRRNKHGFGIRGSSIQRRRIKQAWTAARDGFGWMFTGWTRARIRHHGIDIGKRGQSCTGKVEESVDYNPKTLACQARMPHHRRLASMQRCWASW